MRDWFAGLDDREQKFVAAAAIVVIIAILYLGVWQPLEKGHASAASSYATWQTSLEQLKRVKESGGGTGLPRVPPSNLKQPLVVVIDSTLRVRRLNDALQRSQPTGNNIRVELENVAFDDMIVWLGDLSSQYALHVQSGSFTTAGSGQPGKVNAQLTLGR